MNLYFISLIFFCFVKKCINYIVYPLKTFYESDKIENLLLFNSTYTTIEMGTPPQKVNFYFSLNHSKMFITDVGCQNTNLFSLYDSSSIFILGDPDENDPYSSTIMAMESFYFYDNINLTQILEMDEFPLYYSVDLRKEQSYLCGNIGLSIMQYESFDEEPNELEYYLKFVRSQNNYFSFFNYNGEDFLVNGIFLHQEFKDIFPDIQNISWINPIMRNNYLHWEISMKEIFYDKTYIKDNIIFELNPLFELIVGNNEYKNNIEKDYFKSYINKNICLIKQIKDFFLFECNGNKYSIKDIQNFPSLKIYNIHINYIFEMNGEDLFIKLNNKYYFKIIFPINNSDNKWILGKIFLRKYPAIFSPSNRLVGFYVNPNEDIINIESEEGENINNKSENKANNRTKYIPLYIIIAIISLLFTCCGIFIAKRKFYHRERKANELLDDYYQYDSGNRKEEKIANKVFTSIEMNIKLKNKE